MVMAVIPSGRRVISQVGIEPKWLTNSRIGALAGSTIRKAPVNNYRVSPISRHDHHKHLGYVAILGIAAGMVALVCFYLCLWLVRQSRQRVVVQLIPMPAEQPHLEHEHGGEDEDDESSEMKRGPSGDGECKRPTWNSESVELVLMAGEHVPTFVAHPVVQCPPLPAQKNVQ